MAILNPNRLKQELQNKIVAEFSKNVVPALVDKIHDPGKQAFADAAAKVGEVAGAAGGMIEIGNATAEILKAEAESLKQLQEMAQNLVEGMAEDLSNAARDAVTIYIRPLEKAVEDLIGALS